MLLENGRARRVLVPSFEMNLPGAERAVVIVDKFRDDCLNPAHPRGGHKARVFASTLRLLQEDAEWPRAQSLDAASRRDATADEEDQYGRRYMLDFDCERH